MVKLSVIIVNFNVKYFLEECLQSVRAATRTGNAEIIVVDNDSKDGSVEWIQARFPEVNVIANKVNVGFSKANNQALAIAKGEYVLLLNPDTVVEEDSFLKCIQFMDEHPEAGGLGVKMIDGKGNYLPESKRGFPDPKSAFYKLSGLFKLFPNSARINNYYLGHLPNNKTNEVEVLAGAFMFMRKSVLDEIGYLDETFFMYGEDIDLSWRIVKAGYKNYYFPETCILHYKGESTKKASFNYVKLFYLAMIIFAKKHFKHAKAGWFIAALQGAIYLKAGLAFFSGLLRKLTPFVLDCVLIFIGLFGIAHFWETRVRAADALHYPVVYIWGVLPSYILFWLAGAYFSGGYDKPYRWQRLIRGVLLGAIIIAVAYAFLPKNWQYSRALILLGTAWSILVMLVWRMLLSWMDHELFQTADEQKRILIVGETAEAKRVEQILSQIKVKHTLIGLVQPSESNLSKATNYLGSLQQLTILLDAFQVNELIFCAKDIPASSIISLMQQHANQCSFKIVSEDGVSIVGSNSKDTAGDLYTFDQNYALSTAFQLRNKRVTDIAVCFVLPLIMPFINANYRKQFASNAWDVFWGNKTWIGYDEAVLKNAGYKLPPLKRCVFSVNLIYGVHAPSELVERLHMEYGRNYTLAMDLNLFRKLI